MAFSIAGSNECSSSYIVIREKPSNTNPHVEATIALNCNGQSGNSVVAPFDFLVNNQKLACNVITYVNKNNNTQFYNICGFGANTVADCAAAYNQGNSLNGNIMVPTYSFHPGT